MSHEQSALLGWAILVTSFTAPLVWALVLGIRESRQMRSVAEPRASAAETR
jgi:hypothetical protein